MKKLILLIVLTVVTLPQMSFADGEVIWESEIIGGLNEVEVSPLGKVLYNTNDSIIQVRSIEDGKLIDEIVFPNTTRLDHISITADGKYMAVSGQTKYVIIYDLQERREVKRLTTIAYERDEYGIDVVYNAENWTSSSISPDGTKITGIVTARIGEMTNFVVIDIASEKVLFEQRRIIYDHFNPSDTFYKWHTAEFSPDGKYIISQLEYREGGNVNVPDSVYIHDANTFKLYDVVLNSYNYNEKSVPISSFDKQLSYNNSGSVIIYNYQNRTIISVMKQQNAYSALFSRNSNHIIYGFGYNNQIYDINSNEMIYDYDFITVPKEISVDNSKMFGFKDHKIICLKTFFTKSSVENIEVDIIISPNPTNGLVNITLDCQSPQITYQINNSTGQMVENRTIDNSPNSLVFDFSSFSTGVYYLTINCERKPTTYKIVKEG